MRSFVIGGAGFIGSHLVDLLVERGPTTIYDNMSVGRKSFVASHLESGRATLVCADALDLQQLTSAMAGHDVVFHLAANPEARWGLECTRLDLEQGTIATYNALEAARLVGVERFVLASSGTVYGNTAEACGEMDLGLLPISLYGAAKLAGEALVASFVECFSLRGSIVRFGNVVGDRGTHGAILDFCKKLREHPEYLDVLGDGKQCKPYLHVTDCAAGLLFVLDRAEEPLNVYNLAPPDWTSVTRIAELCIAASPAGRARIEYSGGAQGWRGDVPRSRLKPDKLAALGFRVRHTSDEAVELAVKQVAMEVFTGEIVDMDGPTKPNAPSTPAAPIPKILHHIWMGSAFPAKFHGYRQTWMKHHPTWTFVFWHDGDARILDARVAEIVASDRYTPIVKSDVLRLYALKTMGGMYVDTDFECLKPFDALLSAGGFHCGYQGPHDSVAALASGLMACAPNDPLVVRYLDAALEQLLAVGPAAANREPHKVTGPWLLTKLSAMASITRHARELFYPVLGDPPPPEAYARHHWAGSAPDGWLGKQQQHGNEEAPALIVDMVAGTDTPTVCVALSCKGQAKYLADAVRSLIAQTFTNWQAVIACGDDESEVEARRLAKLDPRVLVLPDRADLGLADARNRALRFGAGSYCMALDADDMVAPTYLERMLAMVGPTTIASCNLQEFGDRHAAVNLQISIQEFQTRIPHDNMIHCASVFPRALWEAVGGYDPIMFNFEDWEFWIALSKAGAAAAHCPEHLFHYRIHPEAMTLRHQPYEEVFRAAILLRYVDHDNAQARNVLGNMSPELAAKIRAQRQAFPVPIRRDVLGSVPAERAEPHDQSFFEQMRSRREPYRRLADCIHAVLGSQRAIDIGCGIGLQTARLKELGWDIVGAERAPAAIQTREPGIEIEAIDLTLTGEADRFDCVICTETAEHVEARFADAVVENVIGRATSTILWSAAVPGQEWPGHVNLRPREYWLDKFAAHGWSVDTSRTDELRRRMWETQAQHMHCKDNFFVLVQAATVSDGETVARAFGNERAAQAAATVPVISFVMRVHNEAGTLRSSITSLFQIAVPIEIVVVLHRCTDESKAIAISCQNDAPPRHRMKIVEYAVPISRAGLETFVTPSNSPHSLVSYYNFAFGLASSRWKFKWDGDFIAPRPFARWIEQRPWTTTVPTVIHVGHSLLGSGGVISREPYLSNCLHGFMKSAFWEVPVFTHGFVSEDAPDEAAFIHVSDLKAPKPYWRAEPWFVGSSTDEAAHLRRIYARAIELVGPEPLGCAASCNPEADAYLERCRTFAHLFDVVSGRHGATGAMHP